MSLRSRFQKSSNWIRAILHNPENAYLFLAIPTVVGFVLLTPPFHGPDEDAHFLRAYAIARGEILPSATDKGVGSWLPSQIGESINESSYQPNIRGYTSQKYDPRLSVKELNDNVTAPNRLTFHDTSATLTYNPISYLPAVIGILPVSVLNGPPIIAMYLARLVTAIITITLFYSAIKVYPGRKIVPFTIFLLPMLLFQQSVVSVDGISYAILAVFISVVARAYVSSGAIHRRHWIWIGTLAILLCFMKPLLFLFLPLILILFKNSKKVISIISGIFLVCIFILASWYVGVSEPYKTSPRPAIATGANPEKQIAYLKENPSRAIRVAWNTYTTTYGDGQSRGLIGTFGSADTSLPLWTTAISVVVVFTAPVFGRREKRETNTRSNNMVIVLAVLIGGMYFIGVNASMYVAYSPIGFNIFYGVQGRYFLPVLLLLPLIFLGRSISLSPSDNKKVTRFLMLGIILCLSVSMLTIIQRYYLFTP